MRQKPKPSRTASQKNKMREQIVQYLQKHGLGALRPKAVLFDMDGVLYNSMPNHAVAWHQAMPTFGLEMSAHDAYLTEGQRGVDTIRLMAEAQQGIKLSEEEAQRMYDEKTRLFHLMPTAPVMEGIPQLMKAIHRSGLQIGVVTGSGQRPLIKRLTSDFAPYLTKNHIVTAYDVERGKPQPDPYLAGLKKMGKLDPWEAIVVENAPLGVEAGVAANIFTIAVNTGPLPDEALTEKGANLLFNRMTDLAEAWPQLFKDLRQPMTQDEIWQIHYEELLEYLKKNKHRPSKYKEADMGFVNWVKYNRKMLARGKMPAHRIVKFTELMLMAEKLRRINQFAYRHPEGL